MKKEIVKSIIEESLKTNKYEKEICLEKGINPNSLYAYKKKYGFEISERGKHKNSIKKRKYYIDDFCFSQYTKESCYWAGIIASDGNISDNNHLTLTFKKDDKVLLDNFLKFSKSNYKIYEYLAKDKFPTCSIKIKSDIICNDLKRNFNIIPRKSLTLYPPKLNSNIDIDSFIIGYIDGDGSINFLKTKTNTYLQIQILGTKEVCTFIAKRFEEILNIKKVKLYKKKKHLNNTYTIVYTDKQARILYKHLYNIDVPKLERKWSKEKLEHCLNYKKYENITKYKQIYIMLNQGKSKTEIAKELNISQAAVSWYTKRDTYQKIKLEFETKQLDKGEENIEE